MPKGGGFIPDYERMYSALFNAITDALAQLEEQNYGISAEILRRAQREAEERYITAGE